MSELNLSAILLVALTALFRVGEIVAGEINAKKMLAKGGREFSAWQRFPIFIAYGIWLAALLFTTPPTLEPQPVLVGVFFAFQAFRWWAIMHLKEYWTTRIVVVPLEWKVTTGPYRFVSHPIYVALVGEVLALSLTFYQWPLGCLFGGLTLLWVFIRMRAETRALKMML